LGAESKARRALDRAIEQAAEDLIGGSGVIGASDGRLPESGLQLLQMLYKDPTKKMELRMEAASRAARFESPALSASLTATVEAKQTDRSQLTSEQRRRRIAELLQQAGLPALAAEAAAGTMIDSAASPRAPAPAPRQIGPPKPATVSAELSVALGDARPNGAPSNEGGDQFDAADKSSTWWGRQQHEAPEQPMPGDYDPLSPDRQ
jgi:hypothetical protein